MLRRLKLDLFMTRSFRKYSAYAFGEILLLVIGILIALQINDWYQQRLDRQTESEYLVSMHRDLTKDIRELRAAIKGNESLLAGLNDTLLLLAEPRDDDAWRRDLYIHGLKYTYWFIVAEFSRLTMAQLQYSGGMRLITNTQLRESMIAYEQGLETAQLQSRDVMTYFHELEESHKRLFDLKLPKRAMEFIEEDYLNMLQPIDVFQSLVPEGIYLSSEDSSLINHYYDDMLYYRTALNILTLMYRQQLKQAESLSKLIENPLSVSDQHEA